jgi:hypothetical protein
MQRRRRSPLERYVHAFERDVRDERVLAMATIVNDVRFIRALLKDCQAVRACFEYL